MIFPHVMYSKSIGEILLSREKFYMKKLIFSKQHLPVLFDFSALTTLEQLLLRSLRSVVRSLSGTPRLL